MFLIKGLLERKQPQAVCIQEECKPSTTSAVKLLTLTEIQEKISQMPKVFKVITCILAHLLDNVVWASGVCFLFSFDNSLDN